MNQSYRNARPSITARPEMASWDSALPQEQTVAAVGEHVGGRVGAGVGRGSGAPKSRRHRHTEQEWNELRDIITHMYIEKDKKAEEVVDFLSTQHNFKVGFGHPNHRIFFLLTFIASASLKIGSRTMAYPRTCISQTCLPCTRNAELG
jgi:hypothetical protein